MTTDTDFLTGDFFPASGFETELHGTGVDAYVQNKKDTVSWFKMFLQTDPGPRRSFGFTNDSFSGRLILFGGLVGSYPRKSVATFAYLPR